MTQQPTAPPPAAPPPAPPPPQQQPQLPKGQAVAAMVCGIIGIVTSCIPVAGLVLGILGTVLGTIAMKKANQGIAGGKGMAIAGLVCGIVAIVWGAFYLIYYIAVGSMMWSMGTM